MLELKDLTPEVIDAIVAMSVYRPASVEQEPVTELTQWRVYEVEYNGKITIHFMGWTGYEGRVSSGIKEYYAKAKTATTASGRKYKLAAHSGHNKDAMYVFNNWISRFPEGTPYKDITSEYE